VAMPWGNRTRKETVGPRLRASAAADLNFESQAPQSATVGAGQASVASHTLNKLWTLSVFGSGRIWAPRRQSRIFLISRML